MMGLHALHASDKPKKKTAHVYPDRSGAPPADSGQVKYVTRTGAQTTYGVTSTATDLTSIPAASLRNHSLSLLVFTKIGSDRTN
jgi:hypothetical protein